MSLRERIVAFVHEEYRLHHPDFEFEPRLDATRFVAACHLHMSTQDAADVPTTKALRAAVAELCAGDCIAPSALEASQPSAVPRDPLLGEIDRVMDEIEKQLVRQSDAGTYLNFSNVRDGLFYCTFCITYFAAAHDQLREEVSSYFSQRSRRADEPYVVVMQQYMPVGDLAGTFFAFRYPSDPNPARTIAALQGDAE